MSQQTTKSAAEKTQCGLHTNHHNPLCRLKICYRESANHHKHPPPPFLPQPSGLGSSKLGTFSWWHHAWDPHLLQFLNLPPSPQTQWVDNRSELFLLKR